MIKLYGNKQIFEGEMAASPDSVVIPELNVNYGYKDGITFIIGVNSKGEIVFLMDENDVHLKMKEKYIMKYHERLYNQIEGRLYPNILTTWQELASEEIDTIIDIFKEKGNIDISNYLYASEFDESHIFVCSLSEFKKLNISGSWNGNDWKILSSYKKKLDKPVEKQKSTNSLGFADRDMWRHYMYSEGKNNNKINNSMKNRIIISENEIRKMVTESVKKILGEANEFARKVPQNIRDKFIKKVAAEHPELDPNGFYYTSAGDLLHNGKKCPKAAPKEKLSKPENMSVKEYYQKIVLPNNQKMAQKENQYADEDWRPVQNIGRYFNGDVDYSSYYEVSNYGRLKVINLKNALRSDIYDGYDAPTRNAMQFHLNGYGDDGASMKTCPDVKYIVADAWLEPHNPKEFKVIHIDGDYHNNRVDNLKWVPRKSKGEY